MGRKPYTAPVKVMENGIEIEKQVEFFTWEKLDYVEPIKKLFGL
jgi:S-adenosylmethionine synthetase